LGRSALRLYRRRWALVVPPLGREWRHDRPQGGLRLGLPRPNPHTQEGPGGAQAKLALQVWMMYFRKLTASIALTTLSR
jgi:hypothetical protein